MDLKDFREKFVMKLGNMETWQIDESNTQPTKVEAYFISKYKEALERLRKAYKPDIEQYKSSDWHFVNGYNVAVRELNAQLDEELKGLEE